MNYVEDQGYESMIYSSAAHFRDESAWMTSELDQEYGVWVAQYWQYEDENGNLKQYSDYETARNNQQVIMADIQSGSLLQREK